MHLENALDIAAPIERIWELTLDIENWPSLTPTMQSVARLDDSPLRVGSRVRVLQPGMRPATWTVTALEPGSRFVWETRVAGARLVGGHLLTATPGGCRNTLTLDVSGWGAPLVAAVSGPAMRRAIATENAGFRRAAEAR